MTASDTKHRREAASSKRYRARYKAGQRVLSVTAKPGRALRLMLRAGRLEAGRSYTDEEIELALSKFIDDEGEE
jgi:hypothetical protein